MRAAVTVACIVVAAGSGTRLGAGLPKAFVALRGRSLLEHASCAAVAGGTDLLVVVHPPGMSAAAAAAAEPSRAARTVLVEGGADRVASVRAGLAALGTGVDVVLVHDAARCLAPPSMFRDVAAAVRAGHGAVAPGLPVVDTVKQVSGDGGPPWPVVTTLARPSLRIAQTPQGFRPDVLVNAHTRGGAHATWATDDAGLVEAAGGRVVMIPGHPDALKITGPEDLPRAEAVLAARAGDERAARAGA